MQDAIDAKDQGTAIDYTLFQPPVKQQFVTRDYLANVEAHLNPKEGGPFLETVAPHLGSGHKAWCTAQRRQKEVKPVMNNRKKYCPLELQDWLNAPGNAALNISMNNKCTKKGHLREVLAADTGQQDRGAHANHEQQLQQQQQQQQQHFTDKGEEWIVLEVGWEAKAEEVVVWYYHADCQKSEEELRADMPTLISRSLNTPRSKRSRSGSTSPESSS